MLLAIDVDYREGAQALAAGVIFADWTSAAPDAIVLRRLEGISPYRPGHFHERELPCLLAVVAALESRPATIVIDGNVHLGAERRAGLGAHLHRALGGLTPVIGVAKTPFRDMPADCAVLRAGSTRPLYVTSIGIDSALACEAVRGMHGRHRLPTMIAAADRACRAG